MFASALIVLPEILIGAVVDVFAMPITEAVEPRPVALAAVVKFRTVFPVIVFVPDDETIPRTIEPVFADEGTYALFKFEIVLLVIEIVELLVLLIPVTVCAVVPVAAFAALMLLDVDVLPIVLLLIVKVVPAVIAIPTNPCDGVAVDPVVVTEPIVLFEMFETVDAAST